MLKAIHKMCLNLFGDDKMDEGWKMRKEQLDSFNLQQEIKVARHRNYGSEMSLMTILELHVTYADHLAEDDSQRQPMLINEALVKIQEANSGIHLEQSILEVKKKYAEAKNMSKILCREGHIGRLEDIVLAAYRRDKTLNEGEEAAVGSFRLRDEKILEARDAK